MNDNPRVNTEPDINGEDLPEWVALEKEIKELSEQLPAFNAEDAASRTEIRQRKANLTARLDEVTRQLHHRTKKETTEKRIAELNGEAA